MNSVPTHVVDIIELYADQCGGMAEQPDKFLMLDHIRAFIEKVEKVYGLQINLESFDLSAEARYEAVLSGNHDDYYAAMIAAIVTNKFALKAPTETSKPSQVWDRIKVMRNDPKYSHLDLSDENVNAYMKLLRLSPNDVLRNGINAVAIVRDHEPVPSLYLSPKLAPNLNIRALETSSDFISVDSEGNPFRSFDIESAQQYAQQLVQEAVANRMPIYIMGKFTISDLDESFAKIVQNAIKSHNDSIDPSDMDTYRIPFIEKDHKLLSDSAMAKIVRGEYGDGLIATLPDNAERLEAINSINRSQINQDPNLAEKIKPMRVFRCATGFGYGGENISIDGAQSETYVMDKRVIQGAAKLALQDAKEKELPITVVLPVDRRESNINGIYIDCILEVVGDYDINVVTSGQFYRDIIVNPADEKYQVVLSGNACGDHITDIVPALQVPKLEGGVLGIGESRIIAIEENQDGTVRVTTQIAEASAGTAPTLETVEKNKFILPAGLILALVRLLAEHPDLDQDIHSIGKELHDRIYKVMQENPNRTDWSEFSDLVFPEDDGPLAA